MRSRNNLPSISVVVPVYNIETGALEKCIESILNQTVWNIEVLLINDGSIEQNVVVCQKYAEQDSRVVFISHDNEGVSVCRNEGIEAAKGKWLAFVDGDDWLEPNYLEFMMELGDLNDADIILCDCYVNYESVQCENRFFSEDYLDSMQCGKDRFIMQFLAPKCFGDNYGITDSGAPWCKLYRRQFVLEHELRYEKQLRRMQDNVFNLYAYEAASKIVYSRMLLYHYRKSGSSGFTRYNPNISHVYDLVFEAINRFLTDTGKPEMYWQGFYTKVVFSFYVLLKIDFANKDNPKPYARRRQDALNVLNTKWYVTALKHGKVEYRSKMENIFAYVMKLHAVDCLFGLFYAKSFLWNKMGRRAK